MAEMNLEDVLRKVAALRRLAERAGTPEEGATAAAKAQELMFAYNLSEAQVNEQDPAQDDFAAYVNQRGIKARGSGEQRILSALASANFCKRLVSRGGESILVGRKENVEYVVETYRWLVGLVWRASRLEYDRRKAEGTLDRVYDAKTWDYREATLNQWNTGFMLGASQMIARRLQAQRFEDEAKARASGQSTALIVVGDRLEHAVSHFYPRTGKARSSAFRASTVQGMGAGRAFGSSVGLGKPKGHIG